MSDIHFTEASTLLLKELKGRDLSRLAMIKGIDLSCETLSDLLTGMLIQG